MRNVALLEEKDREALFRNTASKMGITEAVVEKDFWVCWMLDYLFHRCRWRNHLAFKGGTSLSKAYGLIERFSEDIDLILDWRVLGYTKDEPWLERTITKQSQFNKEANSRARKFLQDLFLPEIISELSHELKRSIKCSIADFDQLTVKFAYPCSFSDNAILQEIRLEIGALSAWTPTHPIRISPYAAQQYNHLFSQSSTEVLTVLPERTFWEKVTILHREAFRKFDQEFPNRYSRHYYDLYRMARTTVKETALIDNELLAQVVRFKDKFYHCPWAHYELAKCGTMCLMPPDYNIKKLKDDYQQMQNMLFGDKPNFDIILDEIKKLEFEINANSTHIPRLNEAIEE